MVQVGDDSLPRNRLRKLDGFRSQYVVYCYDECSLDKKCCPECPIDAAIKGLAIAMEKLKVKCSEVQYAQRLENPAYRIEHDYIRVINQASRRHGKGSLVAMHEHHPALRKSKLLDYCQYTCNRSVGDCSLCPIEREIGVLDKSIAIRTGHKFGIWGEKK